MIDSKTTLQDIKNEVQQLIDERDWAQFHNDPRNTLISLVVEVSELLELFRFTNEGEVKQKIVEERTAIEDEIADVLYNLVMFCNQNDIDLSSAFATKMNKIRAKYPIEKFKGKNLKYNHQASENA